MTRLRITYHSPESEDDAQRDVLASPPELLHSTTDPNIPNTNLSASSPAFPYPSTLILKTTNVTKDRMAAILGGSCREARFYKEYKNKVPFSSSSSSEAKTSTLFSYASFTSLPCISPSLSSPSLVPRVFYEYFSSFTGDMVLLMEDLQPSAVGVNMHLGNQIWGKPALAEHIDQTELLEAVFSVSADLHALFWRDATLLRNSWMKTSAWYRGEDRCGWEMAMNTARRFWRQVYSGIVGNAERGDNANAGTVRWEPRLVNIINQSLERTSWKALQAHLHDPHIPYTLTHGDFHAANMFLRNICPVVSETSETPNSNDAPTPINTTRDGTNTAEGDHPHLLSTSAGTHAVFDSLTLPSIWLRSRLVWVDWSEVGPWEPCADLGQMMISDVNPSLRRACERQCVRLYWERLVEVGGVSLSDFPWERCWSSYERASIERWLFLLIILAGFGLPPIAVQYFHDQVWAFVEDHASQCEAFELKAVVRVNLNPVM